MAQPTPPPITATFFSPSTYWEGAQWAYKVHAGLSPSSKWLSFSVVAPTIWKIMVTVPFSRS